MEKKVVEVVVEAEDGVIPLGIMNAEQAMDLPSDVDVKISHPDEEPGKAKRYLNRQEFVASRAISGQT